MQTQRVRRNVSMLPLLVCSMAMAQDDTSSRYEIGLRGNVLLGDGVPANDILGFGLISRYRLSDGWFIGAAIDRYEYDFEHPTKIVGIRQDPDVDVIDALADNTVISGSIGRLYNVTNHGFDWFWTLGLGFAFPNVDDVSGPTDSGGTFDMKFDVGNEIHLMATLGTSYNFSSAWSASFAARLEHHFMDVKATDLESGNSATIDSQSPMGAYLSLNYRF